MTTAPASRRLRVAVIGNYAPDHQESMLRYAGLMKSMLSSPGFEPRLYAPQPLVAWAARNGALAKWLGYVDKFVLFPPQIARIAADADAVVICDHSNALYCRFTGDTPTLLTCHDLLAVRAAAGDFPEYRTGPTGRQLQRMIRTSMRHADHIVCVSEATCADVRRLVPRVSTSVIPNPLNYPYVPLDSAEAAKRTEAAGLAVPPYFLHVGGNQWYKNRAGVVDLFAELILHPRFADHSLVLAGRPLTDELRRQIDRLQLGGRVIPVEAPTDPLLNALYVRATALLFPSHYEGFGWPIVEAQAAGCPVVTTDRSPMRDNAGPGGAVLIDPEDPEAAAAAVAAADLDGLRTTGLVHAQARASIDIGERYRSLVATLASRRAA